MSLSSGRLGGRFTGAVPQNARSVQYTFGVDQLWIFVRGAYIMARFVRGACFGLAAASMLALTVGAAAQVNPDLYAGLQWRNECATIDLSLSRRFTSSTSVRPSTDFDLSVELGGFGGSADGRSLRRRCGG